MAGTQVEVAGTTVDQYKLERIFQALSEHNRERSRERSKEHIKPAYWLGIREGYTPRIDRFGPVTDLTAYIEQVVYTYMAEGLFPDWFKERFVWPTPNTTVVRLR